MIGDILHNKKAQAAMEFLMTYGWATLIVLLALAALFAFGVFNPKTTNTCFVSAPFTCTDVKMDGTNLTLYLGANGIFTNGPSIDYTNVTLNGITASSGGGIISSNSVQPLTFVIIPNLNGGSKFSGIAIINYAQENKAPHTAVVQFSGIVEGGTSNVTNVITGQDLIAPSILINYFPLNPNSTQQITFIATASDASGIARIRVYANSSNVSVSNFSQTCASTTTCGPFALGPYPNGTVVSYYANAVDNSFNNNSAITSVSSFTIINPSNQSIYNTFYISSSLGNDSNDGLSPLTPWKNLEKTYIEAYANKIKSEDYVLLKRGDVWEGQIFFAPGRAPRLLGAYDIGPKPIIYGDGRGLVWVAVANYSGIYSGYRGAGGQQNSVWDNNNLKYNLSSHQPSEGMSNFLGNLSAGEWGPAAAASNTVWVHTLDNNPPTNFRVFRVPIIYLYNINNTIVENLDIRDAWEAYYGQNNNNITIRNLDINNSIYTAIYLSTSTNNSVVENNTITNNAYTAIYVYRGWNNIIRNNNINGVFRYVIGVTGGIEHAGIGIQETHGDIVEYNNISNTVDSGIDFYYNSGSIIRYNYIKNVSGAFFPMGENLTIYGNIIDLSERPGGAGGNTANTGILPIYIIHNTFYGLRSYGLMISTPSLTNGPVIVKNNIIQSQVGNPLAFLFDTARADIDYNCYYTTATPKFSTWNGTASTSYYNLTSWQSGTGQDMNSIVTYPNLTSNFSLNPSSGCKDIGIDVSSMIGFPYKDYYGTTIPQGSAPDIGAVEG